MAGMNPFFAGFEKQAAVRSEPLYPLVPTVDGYGIGFGYPEKEQDIDKDKKKRDLGEPAVSPINGGPFPLA